MTDATTPTPSSSPFAPSPWILEASAEEFQQQVVERSLDQLVVVDFWAEWCQPCKLLAPILEKLAREYDGKFTLVKADVEKLPELAGGFGVQSIPAVYAVHNGQILDFFNGVLPEVQLRGWIDRLLPSPTDTLYRDAEKLVESDPAGAEAKFREVMELAPNDARPAIALLKMLLDTKRDDEAATLLGELEARGFLEPEVEKLKSQLELRRGGKEVGNVAECRAAVDADPADPTLKLKLAEALAAGGLYEEALETALGLIRSDRKRWGEPGRKFMVDVFNLLPGDSELLTTYRRQLSTSLY